MLKILGRLTVILLVIAVVAAAIYWIVQRNPDTNGPDFEREASIRQGMEGAFRPGPGADGFREREHDFEGGFAAGRAVFGVLKNLVVIGIIIFLVTGAQKVFKRTSRRRARQVAG